jgi:hypothetical protein
MNRWKIHKDIWQCFDHGLHNLSRHSHKDDTSRPSPPFLASLRADHVLLNNAAATQSHIGWPNFLKCRISNEWAKLWTKSMGSQTAKACQRALIQSLWDHTYHLWIFRNNEYHNNDNRAVAQHKQQALNSRITQRYNVFHTNTLPLKLFQQSHFDITQEELLLLSYDIGRAYLRSADLYIRCVTAHNDLARGSHAQHILHHTSGRPQDTIAWQ